MIRKERFNEKNESKIFEGAILIESDLEGCSVKMVGTTIAISGMFMGLIKRIIQETEITKEDMKTLTKIALGEIEEGCLEYDRICDRMINYSIEIEED